MDAALWRVVCGVQYCIWTLGLDERVLVASSGADAREGVYITVLAPLMPLASAAPSGAPATPWEWWDVGG